MRTRQHYQTISSAGVPCIQMNYQCWLYACVLRRIHTYSVFVDLCRLTHSTWHGPHVHTYSTFLQLILFNKSKLVFILVVQTEKIMPIDQLGSHMIRWMSCLPLIKTNNKPNVIGILIDRSRQKLSFDNKLSHHLHLLNFCHFPESNGINKQKLSK